MIFNHSLAASSLPSEKNTTGQFCFPSNSEKFAVMESKESKLVTPIQLAIYKAKKDDRIQVHVTWRPHWESVEDFLIKIYPQGLPSIVDLNAIWRYIVLNLCHIGWEFKAGSHDFPTKIRGHLSNASVH